MNPTTANTDFKVVKAGQFCQFLIGPHFSAKPKNTSVNLEKPTEQTDADIAQSEEYVDVFAPLIYIRNEQ